MAQPVFTCFSAVNENAWEITGLHLSIQWDMHMHPFLSGSIYVSLIFHVLPKLLTRHRSGILHNLVLATGFQNMDSDTSRVLQAQQHRQLRRLRDLNRMEDVLDQDGAKNTENHFLYFLLFTRAILGSVSVPNKIRAD